MKKNLSLLFALSLVVPSAFSQISSTEKVKIEQQVHEFMEKENVPAMSVGIIRDGKTVFTSGFGVRNRTTKQPVTRDTLYQLGSQTKTLTGIITLELIKEGKLKRTDRLVDLLPGVFSPESLAALDTLTLEHVMLNRSGLPNYPDNVTRIDGDAFLGGYSEDKLLAALKSIKLEFTPDEKWRYSNFNYAVLGYVLSKVTNKSYQQLLTEYLGDKYGLANTAMTLNESEQATQLATPYRKDDRQVVTQPWDMGLLTPHGGVYSTIEDMTRLMELQLQAYTSYRQSGVASSLVNTQIKQDTNYTQDGKTYPGFSYGVGMIEVTKEFGMFPETVLFHGGDLDGFGSEYLFSPEHGVGLVLMTSSGGRKFNSFGRKLMKELLQNAVTSTDNS